MPIDSAALAASTLAALEHQKLHKTIDLVKHRLLGSQLCEEDGSLKPFVELVLFEIRNITTKPYLDKHDKHRLVEMALTVAGF